MKLTFGSEYRNMKGRSGDQPAGIIEGVQITNMEYSHLNGGRMEITITRNGEDFKTYVFCPVRERYRSEEGYKRAVGAACRRVMEVLDCFYPELLKFEVPTWPEFCQIVLAKYQEAKDKDKVFCYCVMTYSSRGYLGLRQEGFVPNIERMEEGKKCTLRLLETDVLTKPVNSGYQPSNRSSVGGSSQEYFGGAQVSKDNNSDDQLPF